MDIICTVTTDSLCVQSSIILEYVSSPLMLHNSRNKNKYLPRERNDCSSLKSIHYSQHRKLIEN